MTCDECKARLAKIPDDPTQGWIIPIEKRRRFGGRAYLKPLCYACPYKEDAPELQPVVRPVIHTFVYIPKGKKFNDDQKHSREDITDRLYK